MADLVDDAEESDEDTPDPPEPIVGGIIDLGRLATDALLLAIDPYPRKPDAVFEPVGRSRRSRGSSVCRAQGAEGRGEEAHREEAQRQVSQGKCDEAKIQIGGFAWHIIWLRCLVRNAI